MQLNPHELRQRLEPLFQENFERFGELGAAVSIWQTGEPVLDLFGGYGDAHCQNSWTKSTLVLIWSATKGLASACVLHVLQENNIDLHRRVAEFWPQFGQAGKENITFAQLLSHQAGLVALDRKVSVLDYDAVIAAIETQQPLWPPGTAHGYHARTFGFLLDEIVRRIAAKPLHQYWRELFADPLMLDIWIGLPEAENKRTATMYAARPGKSPEPLRFYQDLMRSGTLTHKAFSSPFGLQTVSTMNSPSNRAQPIGSFGGIGSANALAKFYAMLANDGTLEGRRFFAQTTLAQMEETLVSGLDKVFQLPTAFSAGFMKNPPDRQQRIFGPNRRAFGHPGAGGSHAFADPENGIAFAYVMNQMEQSVLPNQKSLRLVEALFKGS